jgi:hypothetical protein
MVDRQLPRSDRVEPAANRTRNVSTEDPLEWINGAASKVATSEPPAYVSNLLEGNLAAIEELPISGALVLELASSAQ